MQQQISLPTPIVRNNTTAGCLLLRNEGSVTRTSLFIDRLRTRFDRCYIHALYIRGVVHTQATEQNAISMWATAAGASKRACQ